MIEYTVQVYSKGTEEWYLDGKLHREVGPAIVLPSGSKAYYLDDKLHREDGPAIVYGNGHKEWWIKGKQLTEEEFNARKNSCDGKIIEVDGKKYELKEI